METSILKSTGMRTLCAGIALLSAVGNAQLAKDASKFLGNITQGTSSTVDVRSDFGTYWNQATAENECKWGSVETSKGSYNFTGCKKAYDWAKQNNAHFKFHALVWGSQYPSYIEKLSVDETKTAITNWFNAVQKQFPDIEMIDVVNEAIRTGTNTYHSGYEKTKIREALGGDDNNSYKFVTTAFQMARERWPKAILIYNDYNTFQWQVDEGIDLVKKLKASGTNLVDAYGQQGHDLNGLDVNTLKTTIKKIHDQVGIPLFISEYDIGTADDATQKKYYSEQIPVFWEAEYVAGVTLWGYIYGSTWLTDGNSGLIKNGSDRSAMTWLKDYMKSNKGKNTTGFGGATTAISSREASLATAAKPGFVMRNVDGRMVMGVERDGQFMEMSALGRR
jgi:GH35 family endo-1,4-beta-xylanase